MAEIKDTDIIKYKSNKVELTKAPEKGDNVSVYVRPGDEIDFILEGINLEDLNYKKELRKMDMAISRTMQQAILLVTTGAKPGEGGVNPKNLIALQGLFANESVGRVLVADFTTDAKFVIPQIADILDPKKFLKLLRKKIDKKTLVFVALPNDFSELQLKLIKMKKVKKKYWINFPDHISYFNNKNFISLVKLLKFKVLNTISDFPVELLLLSRDLNYVNDKRKGKQAHDFRCQSINYLYENNKSEDIIKTLNMFSKLGIGRNNYFLLKK